MAAHTANPFEERSFFMLGEILWLSAESFISFPFQSFDHAVQQLKPLKGTHDFAHQLTWKTATVGGFKTFQPLAPSCDSRIDMSDALQGQQCPDAIDVTRSFSHHPFALSVESLGILFRNGWDTHGAECLSITKAIVLQKDNHAFSIDPVRLYPSGPAINKKAGRVNNQSLDAFIGEQSLQPEPIVARFKANHGALIRSTRCFGVSDCSVHKVKKPACIEASKPNRFDFRQVRGINRHEPFRFTEVNGNKTRCRCRPRRHRRNLPSGEYATNLSGSRNLLHGNFYEADSDFRYGAETPDNPATTMRVLTIMLARDW